MSKETAQRAIDMLCQLWAEQHGYVIVDKKEESAA